MSVLVEEPGQSRTDPLLAGSASPRAPRVWRAKNFVLATAAASILAGLSALSRATDGVVPETAGRLACGLAVSGLVVLAASRLSLSSARWPALGPSWVGSLSPLGAAALAALIGSVAFAAFPSSADEYGFVFAAETLLRGRLTNPPPADPGLVQQAYLFSKDGHWVSQYLPGWPAVLAAFAALRLPMWLAAPGCVAAMLTVLGIAARRVSGRADVAAAIVLAAAASPFVLLNGAAYFSHGLSAALMLGAVLAALAATRPGTAGGRGPLLRMCAGACLGALALCRMDSALVAGAPLLLACVARPDRLRAVTSLALGAAPFLLVWAAYNQAVTGDALVPPTVWGGALSIGPGGLRGVESGASGAHRALVQTVWRLADLADTTTVVVPALYLWASLRGLARRSTAFYDLIPPTAFALFLVFPDYGGWQMGPRYWFDGYVAMHLTVAREAGAVAERHGARLGATLAMLAAVELATLPAQTWYYARTIGERGAPSRLAAKLPERAFVLVGDFPSGFNARFNRRNAHRAQDFMRNGPDLDGPVLFARADAPDALARACRLRPGVPGYTFSLSPSEPGGRLDPVPCPSP